MPLASVALQRLRDAVESLIGHRFRELTTTSAEAYLTLKLNAPVGTVEEADLVKGAISACVAWNIEPTRYEPIVSDARGLIRALHALQATWQNTADIRPWHDAERAWGEQQDVYRLWLERVDRLVAEAVGVEMRARRLDGITLSANANNDALVPDESRNKKSMSIKDANKKAVALFKKMGAEFAELSETNQSKIIGCSWATWSKTNLYSLLRKKKGITKPQQQPRARRAISLGSVSEVAHGVQDEVLQKLVEEQEADYEPSPLDDDLPDAKPRVVRHYKRP